MVRKQRKIVPRSFYINNKKDVDSISKKINIIDQKTNNDIEEIIEIRKYEYR